MSTPKEKVGIFDRLFEPIKPAAQDVTKINTIPSTEPDTGWRDFLREMMPEGVRQFIPSTGQVEEESRKQEIFMSTPMPGGIRDRFSIERTKKNIAERERIIKDRMNADPNMPTISAREPSYLEKIVPPEIRQHLTPSTKTKESTAVKVGKPLADLLGITDPLSTVGGLASGLGGMAPKAGKVAKNTQLLDEIVKATKNDDLLDKVIDATYLTKEKKIEAILNKIETISGKQAIDEILSNVGGIPAQIGNTADTVSKFKKFGLDFDELNKASNLIWGIGNVLNGEGLEATLPNGNGIDIMPMGDNSVLFTVTDSNGEVISTKSFYDSVSLLNNINKIAPIENLEDKLTNQGWKPAVNPNVFTKNFGTGVNKEFISINTNPAAKHKGNVSVFHSESPTQYFDTMETALNYVEEIKVVQEEKEFAKQTQSTKFNIEDLKYATGVDWDKTSEGIYQQTWENGDVVTVTELNGNKVGVIKNTNGEHQTKIFNTPEEAYKWIDENAPNTFDVKSKPPEQEFHKAVSGWTEAPDTGIGGGKSFHKYFSNTGEFFHATYYGEDKIHTSITSPGEKSEFLKFNSVKEFKDFLENTNVKPEPSPKAENIYDKQDIEQYLVEHGSGWKQIGKSDLFTKSVSDDSAIIMSLPYGKKPGIVVHLSTTKKHSEKHFNSLDEAFVYVNEMIAKEIENPGFFNEEDISIQTMDAHDIKTKLGDNWVGLGHNIPSISKTLPNGTYISISKSKGAVEGTINVSYPQSNQSIIPFDSIEDLEQELDKINKISFDKNKKIFTKQEAFQHSLLDVIKGYNQGILDKDEALTNLKELNTPPYTMIGPKFVEKVAALDSKGINYETLTEFTKLDNWHVSPSGETFYANAPNGDGVFVDLVEYLNSGIPELIVGKVDPSGLYPPSGNSFVNGKDALKELQEILSKTKGFDEQFNEALERQKGRTKVGAGGADVLPKHVTDNWERVGAQEGSNPGGWFKDQEGNKYYAKFYSDPTQAKQEYLSNKIYEKYNGTSERTVPTSFLFETEDGVGFASKEVSSNFKIATSIDDVSVGTAKKFVRNAHLDMLLGNWDVVSYNWDNLLYNSGVGSAKLIRIDQGGTLLHRAMSGRKDRKDLFKLDEWDRFLRVGNTYQAIVEKAGYEDFDDMAPFLKHSIEALPDDWDTFVNRYFYDWDHSDKDDIIKMLNVRTKLLKEKAEGMGIRYFDKFIKENLKDNPDWIDEDWPEWHKIMKSNLPVESINYFNNSYINELKERDSEFKSIEGVLERWFGSSKDVKAAMAEILNIGKDKYQYQNYGVADQYEKGARILINAIDREIENSPMLWRGKIVRDDEIEWIDNLEIGDIIDIIPSSFSSNVNTGMSFTGGSINLVWELESNSKALKAELLSSHHEKEWITGGRMEIVGYREEDSGVYMNPHKIFTLRQKGTYRVKEK